MAKLVFVTAPVTGGKTRYIQEHRGADDIVIDEGSHSTIMLWEIDGALRRGEDVYVSWILPKGATIGWVQP